jgi:hypothetical protein
MKNFKQACFGAATMAVMATGASLIADSAQALSLNGGFVMNGTTKVAGAGTNSPTLDFSNFALGNKTGDFAGLTGTPVIASLALTDPGIVNDATTNQGTYSNLPVPNFISGLDLGGALTFDLDPSVISLFGFITDANNFAIAGPITGVFKQGGSVIGKGFLGVNNNNGISSISLTATSVPTPALLPGLVGMGIATFRRQRKQTAAPA